MARSKSIKVDYKGIKANYKDNELQGILEVTDEDTGEVSTSDINITTEIKDLLNTLNEEDKISINVKKFKPMSATSKKQIFKYHCGCEGNEIKSSFEGLDITCNECEQTFIMEDLDKE